MMRGWTMLFAVLLLAACADDGAPAADGSAAPADSLASAAPSPPTPADSAVAAEVGEREARPPAAASADPDVTRWRPLEWPSEPWVQSAPTAEALLQRVRDVVAAQLEEPDASVLPTRLEPEVASRAIGYLVHPDQADDSVRDVEFRLHLQQQGSGWTVTGVDRREHCRRGVAAGGLCA
jgi:hypothetical protein